MRTYVIELHSVGVVQLYQGVTGIDDAGDTVYFYSGERQLFAVIPKSDIRQLVPVDEYDVPDVEAALGILRYQEPEKAQHIKQDDNTDE